MPIQITPTKIKDSFYLLVPKTIANLIEKKNNSELSVVIKNSDKGKILEYRFK